jgi:hypothetical protein
MAQSQTGVSSMTDTAKAIDVIAYLHTMHMELGQTNKRLSFSAGHPFGEPGRDYSAEYRVTTVALASEQRVKALEEARDPIKDILTAYQGDCRDLVRHPGPYADRILEIIRALAGKM